MGRILLVEDEKGTQRIITKCLQKQGHEVAVAGDGREALSLLKDSKPDLVITDVVMPNLDGFQFFKHLKKNEATRNIPVLILTAREKMKDTFITLGVDQFICKPVMVGEFLAKVEALLTGTPVVWPPPSMKAPEKAEAPEGKKPGDEGAKEEPAQSTDPQTPAGKFSGRKFVVAGHDGAIEQISQILTAEGAAVQSAVKGGDVLDLVEKSKADVLLLNVLMQDPAAPQIVSNVRRRNKKICIMLYNHQEDGAHQGMSAPKITALADKAKKDCIEAGANNTIGQFLPDAFLKKLSEKLQ